MTEMPVIDKFLHAIETANVVGCDAWSADAALDATVPNWRLHAVAGSNGIATGIGTTRYGAQLIVELLILGGRVQRIGGDAERSQAGDEDRQEPVGLLEAEAGLVLDAEDEADAIRAEYARWFAEPACFDELRRYPVEGGQAEVVEYMLSWTENGVPHAAHHLHVLTVRDDRIVADMVFCGGRWPAALLAEMEAAGA